MGTPEFERSRDERKKVEMRFAYLKTHHRFERMRLRGLSGARDEFHLAASCRTSRPWQNISGGQCSKSQAALSTVRWVHKPFGMLKPGFLLAYRQLLSLQMTVS